ncbi:MAG TPA: 2-amino-4-hydroxy-6-hydroxymethyldihydropteridine diphosphokinase [Rugosimonospora sp.]|nr:2-amino-4-hydroxy-6-hydroxymethyldihydropteridine diphosphokinase [Rugosimonospora sp.]
MTSKTIYISLGSNLGDRAAMLARAVDALNSAGIRVARQSSLYITEPVGAPGQAWFLNAAAEAETSLLPVQLLHALLKIERALGRRRITPHGPRTIDLDLLFYGSTVIRSRELEVPHPRLTERRFVLLPLAQIAPEFRHPTLHKSVTQLLAETPDRSEVRLWHADKT